jgi:Rieske Fe-S protein
MAEQHTSADPAPGSRVEAAPTPSASRRVVLAGALAVGTLPWLAACADSADEGGTSDGSNAGGSSGTSDGGTSSGGTTTQDSGEQTGGSGEGEPVVVAAVADVPEGGGIVLEDDELVLTQPSPGQFRGFSAVCTHQGCLVAGVSDGSINCPCHGSMFDPDTGEVIAGPAPSALPERPIIVAGKDILLAQE